MKYCDTSKIVIEKAKKDIVYDIVVNKHYAKCWTAASDIYAIYYKSGEHKFFDGDDLKFCITGDTPFEASASRYKKEDLFAAFHTHEVSPDTQVWLNLDAQQRGLGGASCGPDTLPAYRLTSGTFHLNYTIDCGDSG